MTTSDLKIIIEPNPETTYILNMPQRLDNVQHRIGIMNQPVTKTCRIIWFCYLCYGHAYLFSTQWI